MRLFRAALALLMSSSLTLATASAADLPDILTTAEITGINVGTCVVNGEEQHSLSAGFQLPINMRKQVSVRDGAIWDVYASINTSGVVNGTVSGFASGNLDNWTVGLQGGGSANINVNIPVTGYARRRSRSFGYLSALITVELSDTASARSQCVDGNHGNPTIQTQPPVVRATVTITSARYTGPGQIFRRLRARIESEMRSQFTQQVQQQVSTAASQYQSKRDELMTQLVGKLPDGCLCTLRNLRLLGGAVGGGSGPGNSSGGNSTPVASPTPVER
jgi:hypothetical protein